MRFRKLRTAWTVACVITCLLFVAIWTRSASWSDDIVMRFHDNFNVQLGSSPGTIWIVVSNGELPGTPWKLFSTTSDELAALYARIGLTLVSPLWAEFGQKFANFSGTLFGQIGVPYWFAISLVSMLAAAPWVRWRFSLRTLLISMTLTAVGLGLIVYFAAAPAVPPINVGDFPSPD